MCVCVCVCVCVCLLQPTPPPHHHQLSGLSVSDPETLASTSLNNLRYTHSDPHTHTLDVPRVWGALGGPGGPWGAGPPQAQTRTFLMVPISRASGETQADTGEREVQHQQVVLINVCVCVSVCRAGWERWKHKSEMLNVQKEEGLMKTSQGGAGHVVALVMVVMSPIIS